MLITVFNPKLVCCLLWFAKACGLFRKGGLLKLCILYIVQKTKSNIIPKMQNMRHGRSQSVSQSTSSLPGHKFYYMWSRGPKKKNRKYRIWFHKSFWLVRLCTGFSRITAVIVSITSFIFLMQELLCLFIGYCFTFPAFANIQHILFERMLLWPLAFCYSRHWRSANAVGWGLLAPRWHALA